MSLCGHGTSRPTISRWTNRRSTYGACRGRLRWGSNNCPRISTRQTATAVGQWVLSEDSGLVVPALGGRPGIFSARYGGTHGDDAANNAKLLGELAELPDDQRGGYYVCVAVLADPHGNVVATGEGRCRGWLCKEYRGSGRFGYDPLFLIPEYNATFGELSSVVKSALSHRAKAVNAVRPKLWSLT